ncbi:MAG TPA: proteasome subunit beta [Myxococcota bacterium]|nr:proteasome subunit beta [Myxococcota bacterium]
MFKGQSYSGDSFYEFLRTDHPNLLPNWSGSGWADVSLIHGTTVLALVCKDGVLMAGDRLATEGHAVGTRDLEKVFRIDDTCMMAIAGAAGPAIEMVRMFQLELEHFEKLDGQPLTFEGKANRLSFLLRQNLPAAMQGLVVMPLFAGYDHDKGRGRIYKFDITGGRFREADSYSTGSGGKDARASLKKVGRHEDLTRDQAIDAAVEALTDAADEDRATGGVDLARGIYPTVKLATKGGVEDVADAELRRVYERVVARRSTP